MTKVILKNALITVAMLVAAALIVFSGGLLISPQSMASACENTGNYAFAVTCADLRYKRTKNVDDLARCAQDSILSGKDKLIVKYCTMLVNDEGFESLCQTKDEYMASTEYGEYAAGYNRYIYTNLSVAQYHTGNLNQAIDSAKSGKSFSKLVVAIIEKQDVEAAKEVVDAIDESNQELDKNNQDLFDLLQQLITKGV